MTDGKSYIVRTSSLRAAHAALRLADAIERLERIGLERHVAILVRFDGRKCSLSLDDELSFGASLIPEAGETTAAITATSAPSDVE